jgi:hypothetical protein
MQSKARRWLSLFLALGFVISLAAQPAHAFAMQFEMARIASSKDAASTSCDACTSKEKQAPANVTCNMALVCASAVGLTPSDHIAIRVSPAVFAEEANVAFAGRDERPQAPPPKISPLH